MTMDESRNGQTKPAMESNAAATPIKKWVDPEIEIIPASEAQATLMHVGTDMFLYS